MSICHLVIVRGPNVRLTIESQTMGFMDKLLHRDLAKMARLLQELRQPDPTAQPFCDLMSDAIVWDDEVPALPPSGWTAIRSVWNHRTRVIMGEPSRYQGKWDAAVRLFPEWVGFRPERCSPSEPLVTLYREWRTYSERDLQSLEQELLTHPVKLGDAVRFVRDAGDDVPWPVSGLRTRARSGEQGTVCDVSDDGSLVFVEIYEADGTQVGLVRAFTTDVGHVRP